MTNARLVILFLGVLALGSLASITYLVSADKSIPDILVATVSSSIAALGAILAKTSNDSGVNVEAAQNVNTGAASGSKRGAQGAVDVVTVLVVAVVVVLVLVLVGFLR